MSINTALHRYGVWVVVTALVGWLNVSFANGPGSGHGPDGAGAPLEHYLNPDGTLNVPAGFTGNIDPSGWTMDVDEAGVPTFRPAAASAAFLAEGDDDWNANRHFNSLGANGNIYAVAVDDNGAVYVAGTFTKSGGLTATRIAKYEAPGTTNTRKWTTLGDGVDGTVWDLVIAADGSVYAGGEFVNAGGEAVNGIAKWDGSAWSALGAGVDGTVYSLAMNAGILYVGGTFTTADGVAAANIAAYNTGTSTWAALDAGTDGTVYALEASAGNLYVGGSFATAGGATVNNLAQWSLGGEAWFALENQNTGEVGIDGATVYAIAADGADLYVGGDFTLDLNGVDSATNVAVWNGTSWARLWDGGGEGANGIVYALDVYPADDAVFVGGAFTQAGGELVDRIAKWDTGASDWEPLDPTQAYQASGTRGTVREIVFSQRGSALELYVGGQFTTVGANFNVGRVAYWDLSNTEWRGLGIGVNGTIRAMHARGGFLYIGGDFTSAGGMQVKIGRAHV